MNLKQKPVAVKLPKPLSVKEAFLACDSKLFKFKTTTEIKTSHDFIAQDRAVRAIDIGLGIRRPGYNIYAAGYHGTGKLSVIKTFLEKISKKESTPDDWIYVYNFEQEECPKAIRLPCSRGFELHKMMDDAIKSLSVDIPQALQSEDYENAVNSKLSKNSDKQARHFSDLEKIARSMDFQIKSTRLGIETIPIIDGRALTEKEYSKLSEEARNKIEASRSKLEPQVLEFARKVRHLEIGAKEYVNKLQRSIVKKVIDDVLVSIFDAFKDLSQVTDYLKHVEADILDHLLDFVEDETGDDQMPIQVHSYQDNKKEKFRKYKVNLFVDNRSLKGAPVIIESNPTYYNLFGKIEKNVEHGMFLTDFSMIKPGAIHKANGGYLVLEAVDVLKIPHVWDTFKRILRNRQAFLEDMGEQFSMFPTTGPRPEAIPLDMKVILIGTDEVYHLLHELDEEFHKLFKIKADFDVKMDRSSRNIAAYASFIATRSHKEQLLPFDPSGVAAVIEHSSRLVEDQKSLTTKFSDIKDLTIEADFIAKEQGSKIVKRVHVESAIEEKFSRVNLYEQHLLEMIKKNDLMISVEGKRIGQVNGLAVYDLADYSFGKVGRITCTTAVNDDGILNIERAARLSGNIHDKGIHILTGFLNALLARDNPLCFSASICFEQSYGTIDGDSATIAELVAICSAMSMVEVHQTFAITGSLNQFGDVQPVGGVNEKIEGFHKTCMLLGSKKQTYHVIIPHQNVSSLMLSKEVRTSIAEDRLKIYPVEFFWQAFELATGVPFGVQSIYDKNFKKNSALDRIKERIKEIEEEHLRKERSEELLKHRTIKKLEQQIKK